MQFLFEYGLFLAKVATLVIAFAIVVGLAVSASRRTGQPETLEIENLNRHFRRLGDTLTQAMAGKADAKALAKKRKQEAKTDAKTTSQRPRRYVIDFKGDIKASATESLRHEVSAIVAAAVDGDDVVVRLENAGGVVHEHGLAASQLKRLRDANIPLTVVVDKVAASGGYLMACVADRIVTAPFAIVGSIGVLAQLPNFNRLLDKHGVDFEQITAGKHKRSVTMFGQNTDADRAKLKEELDDVHALFKDMVTAFRPQLDIDGVATGEYWYGRRALELKLTDALSTSDEMLAASVNERDVYKVSYRIKQPLTRKLLAGADALLGRFGLGQR